MKFLPKLLSGLLVHVLAAICLSAPAAAEGPAGPAGALVSAMSDRLRLMEGVAQYKWNSQIAIEDLERERVVLDNVVASARSQGVAVDLATEFFQAQITAAKAIQSRLFEAWRKDGAGSFPDAPDLKTEVRPAISALTQRIIEALAKLDSVDADALCGALDSVPQPLAADAEAWHIAAVPLRARMPGC